MATKMVSLSGFIDDKKNVKSMCNTKTKKKLFSILDRYNYEHKYNLIYAMLVCCDTEKKCNKLIDFLSNKNLTRDAIFEKALLLLDEK